MNLPYSTKLIDADKAIAGFAGMAARADDLSRPLDRLGQHLVRKTARIIQSGERGVQSRHASSGLAASLNYRAFFGASMFVGSNKAQAAALNFGNVTTSSRPGGYLAIPIAGNLRGSGDPKFVSPRLVEDGFFFRSPRTGALLFGRLLNKRTVNRRKTYVGKAKASLAKYGSESQTVELLFVLKTSVVTPAFKYATFDPADKVQWDEYAGDWILRGK